MKGIWKRLAALTLVLALVAGLAACTGGDNSSSGSSSQGGSSSSQGGARAPALEIGRASCRERVYHDA